MSSRVLWRGMDAVRQQQSRDDERDKKLRELRRLAGQNKVIEYFQRYAEYLEWDGIISWDRQALHKMMLAVVEPGRTEEP